MPEPRVSTDLYTGPLDLLLYLCRRAEVDIYNLPIAEIAEQYIKELEAMQVLDLEYAGEFLTMAASLLKLKSDLVLAQSTQTKEAEAERAKLVRQLLEYKRLRDLAYLMGERFAAQSKRHGRPNDLLVPPEVDSSNDTYVENVSPVDLYRAWARLEGEIVSPRAHQVNLNERSVRDYIELILEQLRRDGRVDFSKLVGPRKDKAEVIGNFLALLELVKQRQITIEQDANGEIRVSAAKPDPEQSR
ncbi:MAG: Segregation and condensation protein A [Planctomycetes bacterium]|nr:Segregation and condensation protein A [Planctomycetota bacterium]HRJ77174.1 segregation/condensation protein A [Planctomycetota bacterium]